MFPVEKIRPKQTRKKSPYREVAGSSNAEEKIKIKEMHARSCPALVKNWSLLKECPKQVEQTYGVGRKKRAGETVI